ncbi:MAG TPA: hypothetical protein DDX84_05535 [Nitrospiraceae bacterium]|nr:MAG: hypothetical protein A2Z60_03070 [Nitrospirae bacterium RIFCSPLOWO2_02_42_7]OGW60238.1 MAG: hypothetical protein A3D21_05950 [Nitrospirae bacterium RIFCSPHIGHO2_02_FULL_42_12]HBI23656.1 hypothetical protein [Nitrospiraceae bacterium]
MSEIKSLFEIKTRIGKIRTTIGYWEIITHKHPEIKDLLETIKESLERPDEIRRSKVDINVYIFYKKFGKYWLAIVTRKLNHEGFIITSYLTDKIKEGERYE